MRRTYFVETTCNLVDRAVKNVTKFVRALFGTIWAETSGTVLATRLIEQFRKQSLEGDRLL
jgi:hypothetical protein